MNKFFKLSFYVIILTLFIGVISVVIKKTIYLYLVMAALILIIVWLISMEIYFYVKPIKDVIGKPKIKGRVPSGKDKLSKEYKQMYEKSLACLWFSYAKKYWWTEILDVLLIISLFLNYDGQFSFNYTTQLSIWTYLISIIIGLVYLIGNYKRFSYVTELPLYRINVIYDTKTNKRYNRERFIRRLIYISSIVLLIFGVVGMLTKIW